MELSFAACNELYGASQSSASFFVGGDMLTQYGILLVKYECVQILGEI